MKHTKRLISLLLALCMALTLVACGETEPEHMTVRAALVDAPHTLDPALAVTATEKTVTGQLFEGLMKQNASGVVPGQAASYHYTDNMDGTETYTFTLRNDIYWSDGQKVTAGDFVYAWQRLVDPETNSPHASILNMVAGYADAVSGDPAALQVWAEDDRTLVVVIEGHCSYFLSVVCTAVSTMPVRASVTQPQEGEGTAGDWSMSSDTLLTNGPYAVPAMDQDGLTGYFDVVIGGDLLKRSKPEPDIYLMACRELGVEPGQAYAIEDSYNGIRSAHAAGMHPIMVPDLMPPTDEMRQKSVVICADLYETKKFIETTLKNDKRTGKC